MLLEKTKKKRTTYFEFEKVSLTWSYLYTTDLWYNDEKGKSKK